MNGDTGMTDQQQKNPKPALRGAIIRRERSLRRIKRNKN
jgi:hypothetical protein